MELHLHREIEHLKEKLLYIDSLVEDTLRKAVKSIIERDEPLAQQAVKDDVLIDKLEVELEEDCLKALALYQPVARDLRFVTAILKINNDLERIGDLAHNLAGRALFLCKKEKVTIPYDFMTMAGNVKDMLRLSVDSLVKSDVTLAHKVIEMDAIIDEAHREMYPAVVAAMKANPDLIDIYFQFASIARYLERIADHGTNIAEDVIYMFDGVIVRHKFDEKYI